MRLTVLAVRRNSPCSGRSSISSAIVCDRSPLATAPITRAVSLVGCTRSLISALTESIVPAHEPRHAADRGALLDLSLFADHAADAIQLVGHAFELIHHVVKGVADFAAQTQPGGRQADRKIPFAQRRERRKQHLQINIVTAGHLRSCNSVCAIVFSIQFQFCSCHGKVPLSMR